MADPKAKKAEHGPFQYAGSEAQRVEAVMGQGAAPDGCGPEIIGIAPARGVAVAFVPSHVVAVGSDGTAVVERGYKGRSALRVLANLEQMQAAMARKGVVGFTDRQMAAARAYEDLTMRHNGSSIKGSSAFRDSVGGGRGDRDAMDRQLAMRGKLDQCHAAIGSGIAKEVRRRRPSARGDAGVAKRSIFDRALVDQVCLSGKSLTAVLKTHGWSDKGENILSLYAALTGALERLARCF